MKYSIVIFDFDGTIAETGRSITNCVRYALEKLNQPVPEMDVLRKFVGPPLYNSFRDFCGLSHEEAEAAVAHYRERYSAGGLLECDIYPGMTPLLRALKQNGMWVGVASGKPTEFLRRIIEHFDLTECFDAVVGPDLGTHSSDKTAQVKAALPEGAYLPHACMVGDRCFDIDAGKALGMHTIAVEYGYGNREEFIASGVDEIVSSVRALKEALLGDIGIPRGKMFSFEGAETESTVQYPEGKMISFEGTDGCGKSTQMRKLAEYLTSRGYEVVTTREPGGCAISEKIRELLLSLDSKGMSAECEALLYAAARVEHIKQVILPALEESKIVLCDRFLDSSIAYQAYGRELGEDFIRQINEAAINLIIPYRTLMFDIPRETAKARMAQGAPLDRLELEKEEFFTRVAQGYDRVAEAHPTRVVRIDSSRSIDEVFADVLKAVKL